MIFVRCSKSTHAIGQNQSLVFWLSGNNESFECSIDKNARKACIVHPKWLQLFYKMASILLQNDTFVRNYNQIVHEGSPKRKTKKAEH